jgi:hypothetical protein
MVVNIFYRFFCQFLQDFRDYIIQLFHIKSGLPVSTGVQSFHQINIMLKTGKSADEKPALN